MARCCEYKESEKYDQNVCGDIVVDNSNDELPPPSHHPISYFNNKYLGYEKVVEFCQQFDMNYVPLLDESNGLKNKIEIAEEGDVDEFLKAMAIVWKKAESKIVEMKSLVCEKTMEGFVIRFEDEEGYTLYPYTKYTMQQHIRESKYAKQQNGAGGGGRGNEERGKKKKVRKKLFE